MKYSEYTRVLLWSIFVFAITGCIKERMTSIKATLYNDAGVKVVILHFKGGIVNAGDSIVVQAGDSFLYANGSEFGDITGPGFNNDYAGNPDDSIVVMFDDKYSVTHYFNTPLHLSNKYYLNDSPRNIGNPNSYEFTAVREKNKRINYNRYYFTESDYEYAQK
ncbi:MAG: hypothetical protein QM642_10080 [Edaphocola sp.]